MPFMKTARVPSHKLNGPGQLTLAISRLTGTKTAIMQERQKGCGLSYGLRELLQTLGVQIPRLAAKRLVPN